MHICVIGAGGVGCSVAAHLHNAGTRVTLVGRGRRARAINEFGLRLGTEAGIQRVGLACEASPPADADVVFLAVKGRQTQQALVPAPKVPTVSLQYGFTNEAAIARDRATIGALVGFRAESVEPGVVTFAGPPILDLGDFLGGTEDLTYVLADLLANAGFDVRCRPDIMAWKRTQTIHELSQSLLVLCGEAPDALVARLVAAGSGFFAAEDLSVVAPEVFVERLGLGTFGVSERPRGPLWQALARSVLPELTDILHAIGRPNSDDAQLLRRLANACASRGEEMTVAALTAALDEDDYSRFDIRLLPHPDLVRGRPGMFLGDPETDAAHNMVFEVVGNAVDLHMRGQCRSVEVRLNDDEFFVADDGPGVPMAALEPIFMQLHAGATQDGHWPHVHLRSGHLGVGLAAVNALSESLVVVSDHGGRRYELRCSHGELIDGPLDVGPSARTGLRLTCRIDREIVSAPLDTQVIAPRLDQIQALSNLKVRLNGAPVPGGGFAGFLARHGDPPARPPDIARRAHHEGVDVEVVAWFRTDEPTRTVSLCGFVETQDHGQHVLGFWDAVRRVHPSLGSRKRGVYVGVHVVLSDPRFGGPTRLQVESPEARTAVAAVTTGAIDQFLP